MLMLVPFEVLGWLVGGSWERHGAGEGVALAWFAAFPVGISLKRELLPQLRAVLHCRFGYVGQFTVVLY